MKKIFNLGARPDKTLGKHDLDPYCFRYAGKNFFIKLILKKTQQK